MLGFGLSKMTKVSILVGVTGVALIGLGYAINSVTGLIDEMTENKSRKIKQPIEMQELPPLEESENSEEGQEEFRSTSEDESTIEDSE